MMRRRSAAWRGVAVWALWSAGVAGAQEPNVEITPKLHNRSVAGARPAVRLDVSLVLVPVIVTDPVDRPIIDLPAHAFRVFEDDVEQKIVSMSRDEGPVSVGFLFDSSSSMKDRTEPSVKAIERFLHTQADGDEFFLVRFSDKPELLTDFTHDPKEILNSLAFVQPSGWTALHDAIYMGVQLLKRATNRRRALFVLTDGGDNNSRYTESEVRNLVRESDVRVYSIGLFERPRLLEKMAADTGGRAYSVHKLDDLPGIIDRLSEEVRSEYVLGYSSNNERTDGKYRRVKVEVLDTIRSMPLTVFWRHGYYAPAK